MRFTLITSVLLSTSFASLHAASVSHNNNNNHRLGNYTQHQTLAVADITGQYGIEGYFRFTATSGGVEVFLNITGLDDYEEGPNGNYPYHIHTDPISKKDCETAKGHLNPNLILNQVCDLKRMNSTCEVGGLAEKHGSLRSTGRPVIKTYIDSQFSFEDAAYSMVGRSVVIHDSTKKKLACGTVVLKN